MIPVLLFVLVLIIVVAVVASFYFPRSEVYKVSAWVAAILILPYAAMAMGKTLHAEAETVIIVGLIVSSFLAGAVMLSLWERKK